MDSLCILIGFRQYQRLFDFQVIDLYRQGWLKRGIPPQACESVAEHTLGVAVLTWWLADAFYPHDPHGAAA